MDDIKKGFEHLYSITDEDLRINVKQVEKMVLQKFESLCTDWSKVVDEKNKLRESLEAVAHHVSTPIGKDEDYKKTVYELIDTAKRGLEY